MKKVRTRFAPSPTGPLHIGGVRTALYCYLFAKKNNGDFILRIEDTDQNRYVEGAEDYINKSLEWCGIIPKESPKNGGEFKPYRQSERKDIYKKYALELVEKGFAYYAFDSSEDLDTIRKSYEQRKENFIYNKSTRKKLNNSLSMTEEELEKKLDVEEKYVIRFKMPENRDIIVNDDIRGIIKYNTDVLDDKILFKSDGMPTYHLANVVDDYLMEISHIIRGEEWLPSTPLHILLYESFGWGVPNFAHLPLILKPEGKGKLSKRDGDKGGFPVFPLEWKDDKTGDIFMGYRENGYLPEAFINMLSLLGWNNSTEQEIFSMEELINEFSLERVNKSGAKFDIEKTKWFNQQYIKRKNNNDILKDLKNIIEENIKEDKILKIIEITKDRVTFLKEIYTENKYFFEPPTNYNEKMVKKNIDESIINLTEIYSIIENNDLDTLHDKVIDFIKEKELNMGKIMKSMRLSIVGDLKGVDLFEIMKIIGKKETLKRLKTFIEIYGRCNKRTNKFYNR